jgi:ribosomal protein L11 methyltransferase
VLYRIDAPTREWDRLVGELHGHGTLGLEEHPGASPPRLLAYFDPVHPQRAVCALADPDRGIHVHPAESVADEDWTKQWREGLAPRRLGPLWIRPSWCEPCGEPELEIDPERAFGSGEHATTRLALLLLSDELRAGDAVLDVGSGSGILLLAALRLGSSRAVGLDVDPVACATARRNAARNRLEPSLLCGTLDALRPKAPFDLVVANLLLGRLEPWLPRIVGHGSRRIVLSGYLEREWPRLKEALAALSAVPVRVETEAQSGDTWGACVVAHARDLQSSSRSSNVSSSV